DANSGFSNSGVNIVSSMSGILHARDIVLTQPQQLQWDSYTSDFGTVFSNVALDCSGSANLANVSAAVPTDITFSGNAAGNLTAQSVAFGTVLINGTGRVVTLQSNLSIMVGTLQNANGELFLNGNDVAVNLFEAGRVHLGSGTVHARTFMATWGT